jgi:hypothetical protein
MEVEFTKASDRRYSVAITREHGPALLPRYAPGYDDLMPHDLAHYLVEEEFGIELGVWGQLAAGGGGVSLPAPTGNDLRNRRRSQRIGAMGRDDMARSERLVAMAVALWERSIGRPKHQARPLTVDVDPEQLRRAVRRLDEVSGRWHRLPIGRSLTFEWPQQLTLDIAKHHRGRRDTRDHGLPRARRQARSHSA